MMSSNPNSPLTVRQLQTIAPYGLHSYRIDRYQGNDQRVNLDFFSNEDQVLLKRIYQHLLGLLEVLKPHYVNQTDGQADVKAWLKSPQSIEMALSGEKLGHATLAQGNDEKEGHLIHDLRGGAFQALCFSLQLLEVSSMEAHAFRSIFFLVRDHLKIMRNCIEDLDSVQFEKDSRSIYHDAKLLTEKWSQDDFYGVKVPVHVKLDCQYQGTLCESCLEMASLDRIIYNLMNNAARHTSDGIIYFYVLPVPEENPENVRFIVVNRITEEHRTLLVDRFRDDLGEMFRGGFTTGGHGYGARISADFCAHAYGIFNFTQAKDAGYFGARSIGDYFLTWFHWPVGGH